MQKLMKNFKMLNHTGSSLIIVVALIAVMSCMGCGFLLVSTNTFINGISSFRNVEAFRAAESGMFVGVSWLKQQTSLPNQSLSDIFKSNPLKINGMNVTVDVIVEGAFNYRTFEVQSTAQRPSLFYRKKVCTKLNLIPSVFQQGLFGDKGISMSGNSFTDSYDSDIGPYDPLHPGTNGDIATNSKDIGAISMIEHAIVNGDASTGPNGTVVLSNSATVTGNISHDTHRDLPKVIIPSYLTNLENGGTYKLANDNSGTLSEGNYKYSNINLSGKSKLNISGDVKIYLTDTSSLSIIGQAELTILAGSKLAIYVDGKIGAAGNGITNLTNIPANCLILSTYTGNDEGVKLAGNGSFYGAVYAPKTAIKITGNGDLHGSFTGSSVNIPGNAKIHYDEALSKIGLPHISLKDMPGTWKEANFL